MTISGQKKVNTISNADRVNHNLVDFQMGIKKYIIK